VPYRFQRRAGFVELELFGVLDQLEPFTPDEWRAINEVRAILYNYHDVETIAYNPWEMSGSTKRLAERGIRFAAYAPQTAWFGVNRQLIQMSEAGEDAVRVFKDRAEAVTWLLHGDARPD
jgi:hypothetical protein